MTQQPHTTMPAETFPLRKTTRMAITAVMLEHQKALGEVAKAALEDGEAPEGYVLDMNEGVWKRPELKSVSDTSAPVAETATSSGG